MRFGPFLALLLIVGAGYGAWRWVESKPEAPGAQTAQRGGGGGGRRGGRFGGGDSAIPVSVAPVVVEDVAITREGIGNVQAREQVTVRAQVDGPLIAVAFAEGQSVKQGDVLARIDPTIFQQQVDQVLAKKMQDEAALANARVDLQRYRALAQSAAGSKQQADQQAAQVAQLEAQVKSDEAALANARTTLGYTTIVAPISGRVGLRLVDAGNLVRANDSTGIVTIARITPIDVLFSLPQRDLPLVAAAKAKGETAVEALGADGARIARGALEAIDNQIDASTGTIRLKARFANDDERLWPGQFVSVRVTVETLKAARVVPATAVRRGPQGTFVYAIEGEDRVAMRPVEIATQDETRAAIAKGVSAGERVVTVGFARLTPDSTITIAPDPSAPDATTQAPSNRRGRGDGAAVPESEAPRGQGGRGQGGRAEGERGRSGRGQGSRDAAPTSDGPAAPTPQGARHDGAAADGGATDEARQGRRRGEGRGRESKMGSGMGAGMGSGMGAGMGSGMGAGMGSGMGAGMGSGMGSGMGASTGEGASAPGSAPTTAPPPAAPSGAQGAAPDSPTSATARPPAATAP
jgi:multidrug efflux system membrane fusion protein